MCRKSWNNNLVNAPQIKDTIVIYSLKLLNNVGQVQDKFTVNEDITIQIQYEIKRNNSRISIRLDISSLSGVNLLSTIDNSVNPQQNYRKAGLYSETLVIPKEFLNEGQFLISLVITDLENNRLAIVRSNCLSMKVIDDKLPIGVG